MSVEKRSDLLLKVGLLSASMLIGVQMSISPAIPAMREFFSGMSREAIESITTVQNFSGFVFILACPWISARLGNEYGWGVARVALAEQVFPFDLDEACEGRSSKESLACIMAHLEERLPLVPASSLAKLMAPGSSAVRTGRTDRRGNERAPKAWLVPANPKYFDLEGHLATHDELTWKQSTAILPGDEVYLYVTSPAQEVRYRFAVLESDLPATGTYEMRVDRLMRLRLIERLDPPITRAQLEEQGITHVRGPRHFPEALR